MIRQTSNSRVGLDLGESLPPLTRADTLILPNSAIRAGWLSTRVPSLSGRVKGGLTREEKYFPGTIIFSFSDSHIKQTLVC